MHGDFFGDGAAFATGCGHELGGKFIGISMEFFVGALAGFGDEPADGEGKTAGAADRSWNLVGGAADAAAADFNFGSDLGNSGFKGLNRVTIFYFFFDDIQSTIDLGLGDGFFAVDHRPVYQLGELAAAE